MAICRYSVFLCNPPLNHFLPKHPHKPIKFTQLPSTSPNRHRLVTTAASPPSGMEAPRLGTEETSASASRIPPRRSFQRQGLIFRTPGRCLRVVLMKVKIQELQLLGN